MHLCSFLQFNKKQAHKSSSAMSTNTVYHVFFLPCIKEGRWEPYILKKMRKPASNNFSPSF